MVDSLCGIFVDSAFLITSYLLRDLLYWGSATQWVTFEIGELFVVITHI